MVVMGQQHRVDRRQVANRDRGSGQLLGSRTPSEVVLAAGWIEGRICQEPPTPDFDQDGRSADVGDTDALHEFPLYASCDAPLCGGSNLTSVPDVAIEPPPQSGRCYALRLEA